MENRDRENVQGFGAMPSGDGGERTADDAPNHRRRSLVAVSQDRFDVPALAEQKHAAADSSFDLQKESSSWGDAVIDSWVKGLEHLFRGGVVATARRFLRSGWFLWPLAAVVLLFLFLSSLSSPKIHLALWNAARAGDIEVVRECLSLGVNMEEETDGSTALWISCLHGHTDIADLLIKSGASLKAEMDGRTLLMAACEGGHVPVVRRLLEEQKVSAAHENAGGWTPLLWASLCGKVEVVKYLVDIGVPGGVDKKRSATGESALNVASLEGHFDVATALVVAGANVESVSTFGRTPLISACIGGNDEVVRYLLEQGANCAATDRFARQAVFYACANRMTAAVQALARAGPKCGGTGSTDSQVDVETICKRALAPPL